MERKLPTRYIVGMGSQLPTRLKERMEALGEKPAPLAKRLGFSDSYIRDILRGRAKSPSADKLLKLAEALGTTVDYLVGQASGRVDHVSGPVPLSPGRVPYGGIVSAGGFFPVNEFFQDDGDELVPAGIVRHPRYENLQQYAWRVTGDSMDLAGIKDGMWVVAAPYGDYLEKLGEPGNGSPVIVQRTRNGGAEIERTLKEVQFTRTGITLAPRSSNKAHRELFVPYDRTADNDTEEVTILAVVLSAVIDFGSTR